MCPALFDEPLALTQLSGSQVRADMGGHYIYSKYRALAEALEVCGKPFQA